MRIWTLAFSAIALIFADVSEGATVTITDCAAPPVQAAGNRTFIRAVGEDLVIQCALVPLPGTERIRILADQFKVEGPAGSLAANGKGNAIDVRAMKDIVLENTSVENGNANGSIRLHARTGVEITNSLISTGDGTRDGRRIEIRCTGNDCPLDISRSSFLGNQVKGRIRGRVTAVNSSIITRGKRDRITIESQTSDVIACCDCFLGEIEGKIFIDADGEVDLSRSTLSTGQVIDIESGKSGVGATTLIQSTLSNDFGKKGDIKVLAAKGNDGIEIQDATLIDDDRRGVDVSTLNKREQVPHEGFNNVTGTPLVDM